MTKYHLIIVTNMGLNFLSEQNIIRNGSFEALSSCACADNPILGFDQVIDWHSTFGDCRVSPGQNGLAFLGAILILR